MEDQYTYVNQKKLRKGFTTGSCGAAAALAAAVLLFEGEELNQVNLITPKGTELRIQIAEAESGAGFAQCGVIKDSGDDPDITNGAMVTVRISRQAEEEIRTDGKWYLDEQKDFSLFLRGGAGIGMVTRAGLSCPPGMWAINPVPRKMIFQQVAAVCRRCKVTGPVYITIEIPEGTRLAEKTFNPQLGILGGLSVLGTSGIVEPMSEGALIETIRLEIRQKAAEGVGNLLVVPGNYGERFVSEQMGLSLKDAVKCSNFIGNTLDIAVESGIEKLLLVGHAGKLLKIAAGVMNTHSSMADGRMECLAAYGAACGASQEMAQRILNCITVDEALGILEERDGLREAVMKMAMSRIDAHLKRRAGAGLQIGAVLFTNDRGILGATLQAEEMIRLLRSAGDAAVHSPAKK
ncbi:MAG: cobalt-precorrin-5B (C(1))-methyltransferase CbiD [Lachnospiraceae bacterium]|nr:cobalt-precorrin-5B (C(1))-methyltransferase CbiD [Lachnospiraceae bacterium]MDO5551049.1 cobalt-precorrin-5B (C(1))-methyltransferase CbiD [Lachnospiraceae bacterium]